VIAVDGLDGSGKSRFAASLAAALADAGRPTSLLHVDDFRGSLDFPGLIAAEESALYYERYFDFPALANALAAHLRGPADRALMILEGVMVLRAALSPQTPLVVLEVSAAEARRRITARDQAKGRTPDEIAGRIELRYFPAHARYRAAFDPLGRADLIIDNEDWGHPRIVRRSDARFPADVVAVLDPTLLKTVNVADGLNEKTGNILVNTKENPGEVRKQLKSNAGKVWTVEASEISLKILGMPITNTAMLGAVARVTGVVSLETIEKMINGRFRGDVAAKNFAVVKEAYHGVTSE